MFSRFLRVFFFILNISMMLTPSINVWTNFKLPEMENLVESFVKPPFLGFLKFFFYIYNVSPFEYHLKERPSLKHHTDMLKLNMDKYNKGYKLI